jgi:hypothetical protein
MQVHALIGISIRRGGHTTFGRSVWVSRLRRSWGQTACRCWPSAPADYLAGLVWIGVTLGDIAAVVSDAAPKDPAFGSGDCRLVMWLTGRDGSGHHADQGEQANHGVELVLTVLSRRKALFYAA